MLHQDKEHQDKDGVRGAVFTAVTVVALSVLLVCCAMASAAGGPVWRVDSEANTTAAPGSTFQYFVTATNVGDAATEETGEAVLDVTLPAGLSGVSTESSSGFTCTAGDGSSPVLGVSTIKCVRPGILTPDFGTRVTLVVAVAPDASGVLTSSFALSGGGAAPASTVDPTRIASLPPVFGVDAFDGGLVGADGAPFTQAGGHPYAISTYIDFNTLTNANPQIGPVWPVQPAKDVLVDLPPGLIGNPTVLAKCTGPDLANSHGPISMPLCPPDSQVGTALVHVNGQGGYNVYGPLPVFNMVPPPDVPARFGFNLAGTVVTLDAVLRSGGNYGFSVASRHISEGLDVAGSSVTFWGVPSDPSHDLQRACPGQTSPWEGGSSSCASSAPREAFLRNTTSCSAPTGAAPADGLTWLLHMDSWADPARFDSDGSADLSDPAWQNSSFVTHLLPGYPADPSVWGAHVLPSGCGSVPFEPSLSGGPSPQDASSPAAFSFDVGLPQNNDPGSIGEGDVKSAAVTLPAGVRVSPSSAAGLGACSPAQVALHLSGDASCPDASRVGSVTIDTPLLADPLVGSVYLATPYENPSGSLLAVYLVAKGSGVIVKLAGDIQADPVTGQLTTTFDNTPQAPFSNLHLQFDGGPHAPLATPDACGTYTTNSRFTSWSGKTVTVASPFTITAGTEGGQCAPRGFAPTFNAGTVNPVAGAYSPFVLSISRGEGDQNILELGQTLPPGLLAKLAGVPLCSNTDAAAATCPVGSRIGGVTVSAGAGSDPFSLPGSVYLTGPYNGGPFGVAVVVHAAAGPIDLGNVVVHASIRIDPRTSQASIVADPVPQILQGIPTDVRRIEVTLDRPGFTLNPTNCDPLTLTGTITSNEGATANVASRFQVGECSRLAFKPTFRVSTKALATKKNGASLDVKITSGPGQANLGKVAVTLPKQLPSWLPTIQQACLAAVFNANPASCPAGSNIGVATATTPILANPVTGPVYLVSHGGAAFPDIVMVLQGEGVTVEQVGSINIKGQVTSSAFNSIPDVPLNSFELNLPQGPHHALSSNLPAKAKGSFCGQTLTMPTTLTGQNGAQIKQNTKITTTGCPKTKKAKKHTRRAHGGAGKKKGK